MVDNTLQYSGILWRNADNSLRNAAEDSVPKIPATPFSSRFCSLAEDMSCSDKGVMIVSFPVGKPALAEMH